MKPAAFSILGPDHVMALASIVVLSLAVARGGRRLSESGRLALGRALGIVLAVLIAGRYYALVARHDTTLVELIPLHLCNLVLVLTMISCFVPRPWAAEVVYFWGLGGGLQALLTPDLNAGFPTWAYVEFFAGHGLVIAAIAWLVGCMGLVPRPGAVLRMMLWGNAYLLVVGSIDAFTGWNYGYLRHPPEQASLLDWLGPWPYYLLSMEAVALASFILLDLPWWLRRRSDSEVKAGG